jgi:hypothetical protein
MTITPDLNLTLNATWQLLMMVRRRLIGGSGAGSIFYFLFSIFHFSFSFINIACLAAMTHNEFANRK